MRAANPLPRLLAALRGLAQLTGALPKVDVPRRRELREAGPEALDVIGHAQLPALRSTLLGSAGSGAAAGVGAEPERVEIVRALRPLADPHQAGRGRRRGWPAACSMRFALFALR